VLVPPRVWVKSVTFSDRTGVSFSPEDIVVLVGPNNSGKSVALSNIEQKARNPKSPGIVVRDVEIATQGSEDALIQWLEKTSRKSLSNPSNPIYTRLGSAVHQSQAKSWWTNYANGLQELSGFFVYHLTTDARLSAANPAPNIALTRDPLTHPIHYLQVDDKVESEMSSHFREAFREDLVVHRNAGKEVPLHCGEKPIPGEGQDRVSLDYIKALEQLPALHKQGDGMRSFVGVLLHSLVVDHTVILIDEPEAFLHPPQARLLGQMIVKETPENRQLFVATHSGDFLRGLLDTDTKRVRIVRLQRNGNVNPIKELDNSGIRQVWDDPILRYSNVLDGLFHSKVVLCEADADCRFYSAIMDALVDPTGEHRREHVMFLHCGGKARMPVVISSLANLDVRISVIADFDILNSEEPLRSIWEALGETWGQVQSYWATIKNAIDQKKPELASAEVIQEVQGILGSVKEEWFPKEARRNIETILRRSNPWSHAKSVGKPFIPSGEPTKACNRLLQSFEQKGLFVVPVGELEGFARSVGGHGPKWVNSVLKKNLEKDQELKAARSFVDQVLS